MRLLGTLVHLLAKTFKVCGELFYRLGILADGLLPVLLPSSDLTRLLRKFYVPVYSDGFIQQAQDVEEYYLHDWETEVLDRYHINSGRLLVLGSGGGREAIAVARRGVTVEGVDTNYTAVRTAQQMARTIGVLARFCQADFLALPYGPACFDVVLLSENMYSSIPDKAQRQTCLAELGRLLKPNGLVILSFIQERSPVSRLTSIGTRLNLMLVRLPGTNPAYQPGDTCAWGHFMHAFQNADEIRAELVGAGALVKELNWARGFAVITYPPRLSDKPFFA